MSPRRLRRQRRLDALGAFASALCAAHCVLLPIAAVLLPGLDFGWLGERRFDQAFAWFATLFGLIVLGRGMRGDRFRAIATLFVLGVAAVMLGAYAPNDSHLLLAIGGACIAIAHVLSRKAHEHRAPRAGAAQAGSGLATDHAGAASRFG